MALRGNDNEKLKELCSKSYKDQSIWTLNAFWGVPPQNFNNDTAEKLWSWVKKAIEFDLQKGKDGAELDELNAHRLLEFFKETMTVQEMRENLRSTGAITGNVRNVPLVHILIFKFKIDWHKLVNATQGDNRKELEEAQRKLDEVQAAFKAAEEKAQEAKKKEAEAKAAQKELEVALAELKAQEDAFNNRTKELTTKSEDTSVGVVTRNKAKAELAQHLSSDPLPLRRAKITQEAAVKKAEKATAAAIEAKAAAEAAREEMAKKLEEAERYFDEIRSKPGSAHGSLWWMDRELHEVRAYLPEKKGGYRKQ
jgi:DNA repair exonuclease SbcCD ATPase subunit